MWKKILNPRNKVKMKINDPKLEKKVFSFETALTYKKLNPEEDDSPLVIEGEASTKDMDRMRDIIDPKAWKEKDALKGYINNPIILAYHRHDKPIGRATEVRPTDNGLSIKATISKAATEVYSLIQEGILKSFSVGFIAKDMDYDRDKDSFNIKEIELVEISVVSVPANPYTTFSVSKSFDNPREFEAFKKSFNNDDKDNPETIEENNLMEKSENKNTPSIDLDSLTSSVATTVMKALEEREAAKEATRKEQEARDIEVKTAAERLLEDAKKDIEKKYEDEKENELKEVVNKFASDLEEKKSEIEELRRAMKANKMHYSEDSNEDNLSVEERDAAVLMAKLFNKEIDRTKYFKTLVTKSGREHWESGTLDGWEEEFSTRVHNEMRENLVVENLFTSMPMNTPTMHLPVNPEAGYAEWISEAQYRSSSPTGHESPQSPDVSSTGDAVDHQLKENSITAYKLATKEFLGYEEEEDSIVALLPIIRDAMSRRMAKTSDRALLRGDGTTDLITGLTGLGSSVTDVTFNVNSPDNSTVSSVVYNDFITARQNLGMYGDDPSDLVWVVSPDLYYHLLGTSFQDTFLTMDKIGDRATVRSGQIGSIAGTPVVMSRQFDNTNIATPAAGTAFAVLFRPNNFIKGQLRGMRVESDTDIFNQKRGYVATRRFGFKDLDVGYGVVKFAFNSA